ncbi:MAG: hypothetical protein J0H65_05590 [Rhizobiales bacterium]|nr:hypothetical protein [Hyphomicrobiales bacterium]
MTRQADIAISAHPAPHRERASAVALAYALGGAPGAWLLHLLVNYGMADRACASHAALSAWSAVVLVDVVAITIATGAAAVSYELFRRTRTEKEGGVQVLVEAGEGRTRFLAVCGLLASGLFLIAIAFDLAGPFMGLSCA